MATSQNLEDMKLPELKALAKQMGLKGTSTMRKPQLVETLKAARTGGQAPDGVSVRAPKSAEKKRSSATRPGQAESAANKKSSKKQEKTNRTDDASTSTEVRTQAKVDQGQGDRQPFSVQSDQQVHRSASRRLTTKANSADKHHESQSDAVSPAAASNLLDQLDLDIDAPKNDERNHKNQPSGHKSEGNAHHGRHFDDKDQQRSPRRRDEQQSRRHGEGHNDQGHGTSGHADQDHGGKEIHDLDDILSTLPVQSNNEGESTEPSERVLTRRGRNHDRNEHGGTERYQRRNRGRERDVEDHLDAGSRREEPQDELVPVAGIVDVLDSYAFVRTSGYLPGPNDVYVSMGQIKKYGLRKGDAVQGAIRPPREGDRRNQRQKFVPLQAINSINGMSVEDAAGRKHFSKLTPLYPQVRLSQESSSNNITGRLIDIVAPIGKGQRGLIVSPPKAGKTITLQNIANAITKNNPEVHLMVVLVDERPEEVTDMERTVQGEVISSTFDRPALDHTTVAELAIERAKRLVELGQDVVVLLDSMTRLARAYNISAPASGRILSGGVDAQALYPPKKFFGAARNIENGGSLTIISSALVETGSKMDEVIFEEFKGTGNMELRLSRELADKRLFPAIDVNASGTRREELITPADELPIIYRLRRLLGGLEPEQAYQTLVPRLKKTSTNREFLSAIIQQNGSN